MASVRSEPGTPGGIEFLHRIDQTYHSLVYEIVQKYMAGQARMNSARDVVHFREILHKQQLLFIMGQGYSSVLSWRAREFPFV